MADDENDGMFADTAFGDDFGDELGEDEFDFDNDQAPSGNAEVDVLTDPNDPQLQVRPRAS